MNIWLSGEIKASETLTPEMMAAVEKVFPDLRYQGKTILIDEQNTGSSGERMLRDLSETLKKMNVRTKGWADYYGDCDGRFEVCEDGTVIDFSAEERAVADADDSKLIRELERRGYIVSKAMARGSEGKEPFNAPKTSPQRTDKPDIKLPTDGAKNVPRGYTGQSEEDYRMPNYVRNIVKMEGIANLPLFATDEAQKCFDFEKLIPKPAELDVTAGSIEKDAIEALLARLLSYARKNCVDIQAGPRFPDEAAVAKNAGRKGKTVEQLEEIGLIYASNLVKHQAATWYDWCIAHWGTKWNAMGTEVLDDDTIRFDTAWSEPSPILAKLAERYPDKEIEHRWADEDIGSNTGHRQMNSEEDDEERYDSCSQEAYETYLMCWGDDGRLKRGENGLLYLTDSEDGPDNQTTEEE